MVKAYYDFIYVNIRIGLKHLYIEEFNKEIKNNEK